MLTSDWVETGRRETGESQRAGFGTQLLSLLPNINVERVLDDTGLRQRTTVPSQFFSLGD